MRHFLVSGVIAYCLLLSSCAGAPSDIENEVPPSDDVGLVPLSVVRPAQEPLYDQERRENEEHPIQQTQRPRRPRGGRLLSVLRVLLMGTG